MCSRYSDEFEDGQISCTPSREIQRVVHTVRNGCSARWLCAKTLKRLEQQEDSSVHSEVAPVLMHLGLEIVLCNSIKFIFQFLLYSSLYSPMYSSITAQFLVLRRRY